LGDAPIAVQISKAPILQHLGQPGDPIQRVAGGQPGDPIQRVAGGLPGGAGLQPVAEPVVGVAHRADPIRDAGQAVGAIIGVSVDPVGEQVAVGVIRVMEEGPIAVVGRGQAAEWCSASEEEILRLIQFSVAVVQSCKGCLPN
jgi:hypothetical protein